MEPPRPHDEKRNDREGDAMSGRAIPAASSLAAGIALPLMASPSRSFRFSSCGRGGSIVSRCSAGLPRTGQRNSDACGQLARAFAHLVIDLRRIRVEALYMDEVESQPAAGSWVGSGQVGTPSERMHRANPSMARRSRCDWDWLIWPPLGSRCAQACWAAWYWELLTPSRCGSTLGNPLGNALPLLASGYFGTPCERMQRE